MRIAQVAPLYESVPPKLYGGTERVVSYLTEELVRLGHDVTLFASGDSETRARLVPACDQALWRDPNCRETLPHHVRLMELVFREAHKFDVIHFHCDYLHFPLLRRHATPGVTTLHGLVNPHDLQPLFGEYREAPLVSISNSQRRPLPAANWQATVYHGLPRDLHAFRKGRGDYLLFVGRISPDKRLDRAIEIARRTGRQLKVAAKIYDEDRAYYQHSIEPLLRECKSFVEFMGEVGGLDKDELMGDAYALLFPIDWPEPFGLVMIESLACGTPVIAWNNGSVPEILAHGGTGFVVNTIDEAVKAVADIAGLSRHACRQVFEERFDATRMARNYLKVYSRLIHKPVRQYLISPRADSGDTDPSDMNTTVWPTLSIS
ncbi:MAG: glycosyltransferase family 4 protein [Bryobacteraceae bacterium]|jgi:glycosyltransferase involved in cell wall biosynthesis